MRIPVIDVETLTRNWWVVLLRGLAGILFGIITFLAPGISLAALVLLFGAYAFATGVLAIAMGIWHRRTTDRWWVLLIEGVLGIGAGVITILWPAITALTLLYLIAAWALVTGVLQIAAAIRLRKVITGEWLLALGGIASVALGVVLMFFPGPGALALVIWIGAYALAIGALFVGLGFRLRAWGRPATPHPTPHPA